MARWKKVVLFVVAVLVLVVVGAVQAVVGWRAVLFGPRARAISVTRQKRSASSMATSSRACATVGTTRRCPCTQPRA